MGFLADLRYFGPSLEPRRAVELTWRKATQAFRRGRLRRELCTREPDAVLWERLGLPSDPHRRLEVLRDEWAPLSQSDVLTPVPHEEDPGDGDSGGSAGLLADAILAGRQILFGRSLEVGWPPRWDWRWSGTENEREFARDVRSTWELQRLQGLLPLAAAAGGHDADGRHDAGERYAAAYLQGIVSFYRAHPRPEGVAWASPLEIGLRLVAMLQGLPRVAGCRALEEYETAVLVLLDHQSRWLAANLSLEKVVRGNHLLGELAGLLAAGHLLPSARRAWWGPRDVRAVLEAEILRQFHPDGVSVEQSLTYEIFILEFLAVAGEAARLRGEPFSPEVRERLAGAARHLEAVALPGGDVPRIGDCDSGRGAWFGTRDPHRPAAAIHRTRTMLGTSTHDSTLGPLVLTTSRGTTLTRFPSGGHVVLCAPGGDYLFVRGGPFGWGIPGPAAHSHADWLAPVLTLSGEPLLVDPGVYGYDVGAASRNADRIWAAHGGLRPGPDRGPHPAGLFRWNGLGASAGLDIEVEAEGGVLRGWVRWPESRQPLLWQRSIHYNELRRAWTFVDRLGGRPANPPEWAFRFAPGVRVTLGDAGSVRLDMPSGAAYQLRLDPAGSTRLEEGRVSSGYGERAVGVVLVRGLEPGSSASRVEILPG